MAKYNNKKVIYNTIKEEWRDVPGYEKLYMISDLGRVKSLERKVAAKNNSLRIKKESILKQRKGKLGYWACVFSVDRKTKTFKTHQLVAMAFLNHKPCGMNVVVDHINNIKDDNKLSNLQLLTSRENTSKNSRGENKYVGVSYHKITKKFRATIYANGKHRHLGVFETEQEAKEQYEKALKQYNNNCEINIKTPHFRNKTSKYKGVHLHKKTKKWCAKITVSGKSKTLGYFKLEKEAHKAYVEAKGELYHGK
jgi:hypothetical protein